MGQKTHPIGFRIGITEPWRSRWYARKAGFSKLLLQDHQIRRFVKREYGYAGIPRIEIERGGRRVTVILHCARAGLLIGRQGSKVDQLQRSLEQIVGDPVELKIREVKRPELEPQLVAEGIAEQLVKRAAFRRTMKKAVETTMMSGAEGVKVMVAGRLGGAEMARREVQRRGRIPLQTLNAQVDYGFTEARTTYGVIGVKVWIYKGLKGADQEGGKRRGRLPHRPAPQR
jgi:small subunit ribosomal protein S3